MFRSALLILSGQAFGSLFGLARNLFIARLISVENYGIAATFAITMSLIEMVTSLGLNQLIIQDRDGNSPELQSGLQGFNLLRSAFSGGMIFLLAHPIGRFLGTEDVAWAYQVVALIPVLNGLIHFDIYRMQRSMSFLPSILTGTVPSLLSLLLIWPLFSFFQDYRVMLYAILAQAVASVVVSHVVAERPYRVTFDSNVIGRSLRFGWPLLINNFLLFFIFQGEKVIVGRELGVDALGHFAMGMTLTLTPALVLAGSSQTFFLPQLSANKDDPTRFGRLAMATFQIHMAFGLFLVVSVMLLGRPLILLLLGDKYSDLVPLMVWLAMLQSLRLFRGGSATVALSQGRTGIATVANLVRVLCMPISWYVVANGGSFFLLLWIAIASETVGFLISLFLVRRQLRVSLNSLLPSLSFTFFFLSMVWLHTALSQSISTHSIPASWTVPAIVLSLVMAFLTMADLRRYIVQRSISFVAH